MATLIRWASFTAGDARHDFLAQLPTQRVYLERRMTRTKARRLGRPPKLSEVSLSTRSRIQLNDTGCWIWTGSIPPGAHGYGPYKRLYERYVGPRPEGYDLHHVCERGPEGCCNPAHLELLPSTAHRRMHRQRDGKLGKQAAAEVREHLVNGFIPMEQLAEMYGVTRTVVQKIGLGDLWLGPDEPKGQRMVYTRTCGWCGVTFETTSRRKRYCCTTHQKWYSDRQRYLRNRGTDSTYVRPKKRQIADPRAAA